jgi:hypothetical protein
MHKEAQGPIKLSRQNESAFDRRIHEIFVNSARKIDTGSGAPS